MYNKNDLMNDLKTIGINPHGAVLVHSSYKAIGDVDGRADTVLDALMEYMKAGLLVLPAHTWGHVRALTNPVYDVLYTPTCVGRMTEMFRKRAGVIRSLHPTHSLAAIGAAQGGLTAAELFEKEETINTPCGKGGAYWKLWEMDAQILMIGVNFSTNTFIHGCEEWDGAEGFISKSITDLYTINHEGQRLHTPQYRHDSHLGSAPFVKLEPEAIQKGILTLGQFGDATTRVMHMKPLREMVAAQFAQNPRYLNGY